jgi:hypothetical protein
MTLFIKTLSFLTSLLIRMKMKFMGNFIVASILAYRENEHLIYELFHCEYLSTLRSYF